MLHNNQITRSLCAVMLSLCLLLPGTMSVPAEAAEANDVYAIDIEFGNLSFYYDYGVWDVNDMRYEAAETSANPANGTDQGFPGWYGFDGIANKIKIKNSSQGDRGVTVALSYRALLDSELSEAGVDAVVSGISMTVDGWTARGVDYTAEVPVSETGVEAYLHLSGEPVLPDSAAYSSATMQPIGMLTITIESP